jgi:hypothetical protein
MSRSGRTEGDGPKVAKGPSAKMLIRDRKSPCLSRLFGFRLGRWWRTLALDLDVMFSSTDGAAETTKERQERGSGQNLSVSGDRAARASGEDTHLNPFAGLAIIPRQPR